MHRSARQGLVVLALSALAAFGIETGILTPLASSIGSVAAAQVGPEPLPELAWKTPATTPEGKLFDSTEIAQLLAILESSRLRSEEFSDLRSAAASRLRHRVQGAGDPFIAEAVRRISSPDAGTWEDWDSDERRDRAMLLLSLVPSIPRNLLDGLNEAEAPVVRAYRLVRGTRWASPSALDDPRLYRSGPAQGADPLQAAAEVLLPLLRPNPLPEGGELEDFTRSGAPRVREFWAHVPPDNRWMVDLDGDGLEEMFVKCPALWPMDEDYVHDDLRFLALLRRESGAGPWRITYFRRLGVNEGVQHIAVADFDGDGKPEIGIWTSNGCGILCERGGETRALLTVLSGENRGGATIDSYRGDFQVSAHRETETSPPIFGSWDEYCGVSGRKVFHGSGVIAYEGLMYRWSKNGFVRIGRVFVPFEH